MSDFLSPEAFIKKQSGSSLTEIEFANNPDPRCPCILLLDTSGSMEGEKIRQLTEGFNQYIKEISKDELALRRVDFSVFTFGGGTELAVPFKSVDNISVPRFTAGGDTPMGEVIVRAIELLKDRKKEYKSNGIPYYRPWIFLITDGEPTDNIDSAIQAVQDGEEKRMFTFFSVGVDGANMNILKKFSKKRAPLALKGMNFKELFCWLSASQKNISHSKVADTIKLEPTDGWSIVSM